MHDTKRQGRTQVRTCLALISWLGLAASIQACTAEPMIALQLCQYKPVFMEEFDTLSVAARTLGLARWTAHTPWNGDFGDAAFVDPGPTGPFTIQDGKLLITAHKTTTGRWISGLIAAADASGRGSGTADGYFEARMRMPLGPGTWPAFWLSSLKPAADPQPGVELDVVEYYGHDDTSFFSSLHVWYNGADKDRSRHELHRTMVPPGSLVTDYHDYGVRVAPEAITYYIDRKPVWQMPHPPELQGPLFPLVNLALGSGFPIDKTPDPSVLMVDYVHVYARDPAARCSTTDTGVPPAPKP